MLCLRYWWLGFVVFFGSIRAIQKIADSALMVGHEYAGSESMVRYGKQYNPTVLLATLKTVDFGLDVPSLKEFAASL